MPRGQVVGDSRDEVVGSRDEAVGSRDEVVGSREEVVGDSRDEVAGDLGIAGRQEDREWSVIFCPLDYTIV